MQKRTGVTKITTCNCKFSSLALGIEQIQFHRQLAVQSLEHLDRVGIDHLSFAVDDPADATREVKYLGGVDFAIESFENQQSGRTISNCNDPDGLLIQICKQTAPGTYKNWE